MDTLSLCRIQHDKRSLFVRVVDDIVDQIRTGKLFPGDVLPTARKMADIYDVASMTAQRALRELQQLGLTYGVVGKGTFVHPLAAQRVAELDGQPLAGITQAPVIADDPALNRRLAQFLLERNRITAKIVDAFTANDVEAARAATEELAALQHADTGLIDDLARYEANLSRVAGDTTDTKPAKPRRKPKP